MSTGRYGDHKQGLARVTQRTLVTLNTEANVDIPLQHLNLRFFFLQSTYATRQGGGCNDQQTAIMTFGMYPHFFHTIPAFPRLHVANLKKNKDNRGGWWGKVKKEGKVNVPNRVPMDSR